MTKTKQLWQVGSSWLLVLLVVTAAVIAMVHTVKTLVTGLYCP